MSYNEQNRKGVSAWFSYNPVAANLLMVLIIIAGIYSAMFIQKELLPKTNNDTILISVTNPGSSANDNEKSIIIPIEQSLKSINGIEKTTSYVVGANSDIHIKVIKPSEFDDIYEKVKTNIENITNLPKTIEIPKITKKIAKIPLMTALVYGDKDQISLQRIQESLTDKLRDLNIGLEVNTGSAQPYEIVINLSKFSLEQYQLSFNDVLSSIKKSSNNISSGIIEHDNSDIFIKANGRIESGFKFGNTVIKANDDGSEIYLRDIATITDGVKEDANVYHYNNHKAVEFNIFANGQSIIESSKKVKEFIQQYQTQIPEGVYIKLLFNTSDYLKSRLHTMVSNMISGSVLVFLLLALFLRTKIAFWVMVGMPISFFGGLALMPNPFIPASINMLSVFGFILVLGIIVDDAILIAENSYSKVKKHGYSVNNIIDGVYEVMTPATFGVLTTIAVFLPMLISTGDMAPFLTAISVVVILCLICSLIESKLILPAHIANMNPKSFESNTGMIVKIQDKFSEILDKFIQNKYIPILHKSIKKPILVITIFISILWVSIALLMSPFLKKSFFPEIDQDTVQGKITFYKDLSHEEQKRIVSKIEDSIKKLNIKYKKKINDILFSEVTVQSENHLVSFFLELSENAKKHISIPNAAHLLRDEIGSINNVKSYNFSGSQSFANSKAISYSLTSDNSSDINQVISELETKLNSINGVIEIENSADADTDEINMKLKPIAKMLGVNLTALATQVRYLFYGYEVQNFQRNKEEIKTYIRFPESDRESINDFKNAKIDHNGQLIYLSQLVDTKEEKGTQKITRKNGHVFTYVSANTNSNIITSDEVLDKLNKTFIPKLQAKYPNVQINLDGASLSRAESQKMLGLLACIALVLVYALIAIPLKSYFQPLIVMSIIPFGIIGVFIGHFVMNLTFSMMSIFGIIALSGVLINNSLVLLSTFNKNINKNLPTEESILQAGKTRFRAVILTSLTTFFGLIPISLETSLQAQFLIPTAISLAFGILFGTAITLILTPVLCYISSFITHRK